MKGLRGGVVARQAGWGLADQGLSSLTNFLLGLSVARAAGPGGLGAFSLAFATYAMMLNVSQGLGTEPLVVRFSASADAGTWDRRAAEALGVPVALGVAAGAACLAVAALTGGALRAAFLGIGVTFPGLLLQDAWRSAFFARRRAVHALLNDLVWAVVLVAGLGLLHLTHRTSILSLTLAWGFAASTGAVVGMVQSGIRPRPARMRAWLRAQRDLAPRYLGELTIGAGSEPLTFYAVGAIAGLAVVGSIRGAQILLGPLYVCIIGMRLAAMPEAVRLAHGSTRRVVRLTVGLGALIVAAAGAWDATVLAIPDRMGRTVMATAWAPSRSVLIPVSIAMAGSGVMGAAVIGMRALAAARASLRAKLIGIPLIVACGVTGASIWGGRGAAWGMAVGYPIGAAVCWLHFGRELRTNTRAAEPLPRADAPAMAVAARP